MPFREDRYHHQLQQYWEKIKGDRPFPTENEIDPDDLKEIWATCFLVSIDDVTRRLGYRYSYLGTELIEAYGDDTNNPDIIIQLLSSGSQSMVHKFDEVIRSKKPVIDESEFVNLKHMHIRYRTCLLPLGPNPDAVSHIIGCMRWKIY